jgi:hypothetical protein
MSEPTVRRCGECGAIKPTDEFYRDKRKRDGLFRSCKDCVKTRARRWHREEKPEVVRRRQAENPEAAAEREQAKIRYVREFARRQHAANREAVLDHYGRSCACCGGARFLGVDHINGDGRKHRAEIGMGSSHLYRWLIANGFPEGFQVLCNRCNTSKGSGEQCRVNHQAA